MVELVIEEQEHAYYPWRRYFARILDVAIYGTIWSAILGLIFHVNIMNRSNLEQVFDTFIAIAMMLAIEPLFLQKSGTTPGKYIFGIRITTKDGSKLSYFQALQRTWEVIGAGMGYNIPVYNLVRLWKSYKSCSQNTMQPWNMYLIYKIKDTKKTRWIALLAAYGVL